MGKYYAVANGRANGVYDNWDACKAQVSGYSGAKFKSFPTKAAAEAFAKEGSNGSRGGNAHLPFSFLPNSGSRPPSARPATRPTVTASRRTPYSHPQRTMPKQHVKRASGPPSVPSSYEDSNTQVVYTDGSALGNGKRGSRAGWGIFWGANDSRNASGKVTTGEQTNNRGELDAIYHAVQQISKEVNTNSGTSKSYEIRADSQYARDSLEKWGESWESNGWKTSTGGAVKNRDLIEPTRNEIQKLRASGVNLNISYVPGHAGHAGNEAADLLARKAAGS